MVTKATAVDWRDRVGDQLMSPRDAMSVVNSGDQVWVGGLNSVPITLCQALADRADELADVTISTL